MKNYISKFWKYLKKDTWDSWLVSLILIFVVIKFVFFPLLTLITGSPLPLVVIESCSMYHGSDFNSWWGENYVWYESKDLSKETFQNFPAKNGLNKGDIMLVLGHSEDYKEGDIIVFSPNQNALSSTPIIHRIVSLSPIATKGDHNSAQLVPQNNVNKIDETSISKGQIMGKANIRIIPYVGWIKLIFFEPFKPKEQRGFC